MFNRILHALSLVFITLSMTIVSLQGQQLKCGTSAPTPEMIRHTIDHVSQIEVSRNTGTTKVPIRCHIFRADDGSGGVTNEQLARGLANLNNLYLSAGIEFFYCGAPNYINNSDLYDFDETDPDNDTEEALVAATTEASDAVNVYFINSIIRSNGSSVSGYASYPCNSIACNRVVMDEDIVDFAANGTYVHEFGHFFNLFHTHNSTEFGNTDLGAEHVPRSGSNSNCLVAGDLLCDTEADPRYNSASFSNCMDTGGEEDVHGNPYTAPVDNIMSYYPDGCGGLFEADQYVRIAQGLQTRLDHTTYSLGCTPEVVAVPTGLTGALNANENGVELNWTDAANNEMGYLLERSTTSAIAGFQAQQYAGVSEDVTTFTDGDISANTTYWYRVKPINGDADLYSNVVMVEIGLIYCSGGGGCDEYISEVDFLTIGNTTTCSAGGYGKYTNLSADLAAGESAVITITNGNPFSADECGIWVDWNQDGDFEDENETIAVTGSPGIGPYTATITAPTDAVQGGTRMRARITWNTNPTDCNTHTYGEVEDYTINVLSALPVELISFEGESIEDANILRWETATELNNDHFELEVMKNGRFENLANIEGAGTTAEDQQYSYIDRFPKLGFNYYRLKQVDFDGKFAYSGIIVLESKEIDDYEIYPTPTSDLLIVHFNGKEREEVQYTIVNSMGTVIEMPVPTGNGENSEPVFDVSELPVGVYFLKIKKKNSFITKRFVKA